MIMNNKIKIKTLFTQFTFAFALFATVLGSGCSSDNSLDISDKGKNRGNPGPVPSKPTQSAQLSLSQVSVVFGDFVEFEKSISILFQAIDAQDSESVSQSFNCPRVTKDRSLSSDTLHFYHLDWRFCRGGDYRRIGQDCAKVTLQNQLVQSLEVTSLLPSDDPRYKKGICNTESAYEGLSLPVKMRTSLFLQREKNSENAERFSYSRSAQLVAKDKNQSYEMTITYTGELWSDLQNFQFRYKFDEIKTEWFDFQSNETIIDEVVLTPLGESPLPTTACHRLTGEFTGVTTSTRLDSPLDKQSYLVTDAEVNHVGLKQKRLWPSCKTGGDLHHLGFLDQYLRNYKSL